jgi:ribonuclease P protein component
MIAKDFRLKPTQIDYLTNKGGSFNSKLFITKYAENNKDYSRFCVIISKKISPEAVTRNRLRRQIFESIRTSSILKDKIIHLDIILIPKKSILNKSFSEINEDISTLPSKITNQNGPKKNQ